MFVFMYTHSTYSLILLLLVHYQSPCVYGILVPTSHTVLSCWAVWEAGTSYCAGMWEINRVGAFHK